MKFLFLTIVLFTSLNSFSQSLISNTRWKGHLEIPESLDIMLLFKMDSVIATLMDGSELELMSFTQVKDTLKLRKLNGQSPCDQTTEGSYIIELAENGDKLLLHWVKDDCKERAQSITSASAYYRVKD